MSTAIPLPPPQGYANWLDFAVETFDTRGLWAQALLDDGDPPDRDAMREAAREELRQLRTVLQRMGGNGSA